MPLALPDATLPLVLRSPALFAAAIAISLAIVAIAIVRRAAISGSSGAMITIGLIALSLAAGGLYWRHRQERHIAVVVDHTPSTRSATFHDERQLQRRIEQLLGDARYSLQRLGSPGSTRTTFEFPATAAAAGSDVDAFVLFSDARFHDPPPRGLPPVYPVIDPALEDPADAAVERLEFREGTREVAATVRNATAAAQELHFDGAHPATQAVKRGRMVKVAKPQAAGGGGVVSAWMRADDAWPENDALEIRLPPPAQLQRWWVGRSNRGGEGWRHVPPADLPGIALDYLSCGVMVLDNLSADDITRLHHERIEQYVRDLGGGLVIVGGERAFAAGGYAGTALERLSPLASTPPQPAMHWVLLADSSGSMAQKRGDNTRWHFAAAALFDALQRLPPDDPVSIGHFAQALRWWRAGEPAGQLQEGFAVPRIAPTGPTNLGTALKLIADTNHGNLPTQLLLITDAEAAIDNPAALATRLKASNVRVHLLSTAALPPGSGLRDIIDQTNGTLAAREDPRQWSATLQEMMQAASPDRLGTSPLTIRSTDAGPRLAELRAQPWNRTWLKPRATDLARGHAAGEAEEVPAIAAWNLGAGAVISTAFAAPAEVVAALAERVAISPRDPRFKVAVEDGPGITVTVDAADEGKYLNGLSVRLNRSLDGARSGESIALPQVAPGRYEVSFPATQRTMFVTLSIDGRAIHRFATAGRYAPEFESIGNDRAAMERLARDTGGAVIEPAQTRPIDFQWPVREIDLSLYAAAAGAIFISAGLIRWRIG